MLRRKSDFARSRVVYDTSIARCGNDSPYPPTAQITRTIIVGFRADTLVNYISTARVLNVETRRHTIVIRSNSSGRGRMYIILLPFVPVQLQGRSRFYQHVPVSRPVVDFVPVNGSREKTTLMLYCLITRHGAMLCT